jgi:MFS family permease
VSSPDAFPSRFRAWTFIALLFTAAMLSNLDRNVFGVLIDAVREDLHISDVQISLLIGLAYGLLAGPLGVVIGFLTDRLSRKLVICSALALWGGATIMGGLSPNTHWLFVSRALVGVGEAALTPVGLSLIADLFPPRMRGRPVSLYLLGASVGTGLALLLPGLIAGIGHAVDIAGVVLQPWRLAFVTCGALALLPICGFLAIPEPRRRGVMLTAGDAWSIRPTFMYFRRYWKIFVPFYLAFSIFYLSLMGTTSWSGAFLMRQYLWSARQTGVYLGLVSLAAGVLGYLAGGMLLDRLGRANNRLIKLAVLVACPLAGLPSAFAVFAPDGWVAMGLLALLSFFAPFIYVGVNVTVQDIVPANMRGVAISFCGLNNAIISYGLGPLLIAWMTEYVFVQPKLIGFSILAISAPALILASLTFFLALRALRSGLRTDRDLRTLVGL